MGYNIYIIMILANGSGSRCEVALVILGRGGAFLLGRIYI
jgi:hypothetical protein